MKFRDFETRVQALMPGAMVDRERDGQLLIYTNMMVADDDTVVDRRFAEQQACKFGGNGVDIKLRETRSDERVFWSKRFNSYVMVKPREDAVPPSEILWKHPFLGLVYLMSINGAGEIRWELDANSSNWGDDGAEEAIAYFGLKRHTTVVMAMLGTPVAADDDEMRMVREDVDKKLDAGWDFRDIMQFWAASEYWGIEEDRGLKIRNDLVRKYDAR